jgi:hypothetical protein
MAYQKASWAALAAGGLKTTNGEERGVPTRRKAEAAQAEKEIAQTGGAVEDASEQNACEAGTQEHRRKHQYAGHFWERLVVEKMGSSYQEGPEPGKEESQRETAKDGVTEPPGSVCRGRGRLCQHETAILSGHEQGIDRDSPSLEAWCGPRSSSARPESPRSMTIYFLAGRARGLFRREPGEEHRAPE